MVADDVLLLLFVCWENVVFPGSFVVFLLADRYVVYCVLFVCIFVGNYFSTHYSFAFLLCIDVDSS